MLLLVLVSACEAHPIAPHATLDEVRKAVADEAAESDPTRYLKGGERVFFDDFERAELGDKWVTTRLPDEANPPDWRIEGGWVRAEQTKNQGIFANVIPPGNVRVEVVMKSLPPSKGKFAGDLKFEAFNTEPAHETGYSFINGGWNNQFDTIAKLGEHSADDRRVGAQKITASKEYRYAAVRAKTKLFWFRDGELLYTFDDAAPLQGSWVGLNNWTSNAAFGEVSVFKLPD